MRTNRNFSNILPVTAPKLVFWSKHKNSGKILSFPHRKECIIALETGETDKSYNSILDLRKKHRKSVKKMAILRIKFNWFYLNQAFSWNQRKLHGYFLGIFTESSESL